MAQQLQQGVNQATNQAQGSGKIATDFFVYDVIFSALVAGTSQTNNIQIQADSDFEIQKLTAQVFQTLAADQSTTVQQAISVLITDTGTGRQLSDIAVPLSNLFGDAKLPFILPNTKILSARSILAIQVSNYSSAVTYARVQLSFIGRKIFRGFQ